MPPSAVPKAAPAAVVPRALPDVSSEWCLEGWRGLDEATCYVVPDPAGKEEAGSSPDPDELLIYLAGIVPPGGRSAPKEHVQRVVGNVARRHHVAALLPRGRVGIGPKDAKDWWAWPTSAADYVKYASTLVEEWKTERRALEDALGHPFKRVYLAGSSSGAYFLALLAFDGAVDFDGYAACSGGAPGPGPSAKAVKRPFYVGWGEGDPTNAGPKALAAELKARGWPTIQAQHPTGHGAREVYLDEALTFFRNE
jgi:predicted esterase